MNITKPKPFPTNVHGPTLQPQLNSISYCYENVSKKKKKKKTYFFADIFANVNTFRAAVPLIQFTSLWGGSWGGQVLLWHITCGTQLVFINVTLPPRQRGIDSWVPSLLEHITSHLPPVCLQRKNRITLVFVIFSVFYHNLDFFCIREASRFMWRSNGRGQINGIKNLTVEAETHNPKQTSIT